VNLKDMESSLFQKSADFFIRLGVDMGYDYDKIYSRIKYAHQELDKKGNYTLSREELTYGTQLAWQNAYCTNSDTPQKQDLLVVDCRSVRTAEELFNTLCEHLKESFNEVALLPIVTVLPTTDQKISTELDDLTHKKIPLRILNKQLLLLAGYTQKDGSVIGDPLNIELTEFCLSLGWTPPTNNMTHVLPLVIDTADGVIHWFQWPCDSVKMEQLTYKAQAINQVRHIKQNTISMMSDMILEIGGLLFPVRPIYR
jgi:nitric oxide synthase oxygenase domain/subunit